jgi:hypothetical protein
MEKAKRARKAETPRQPSLCLRLRAPYLYPDRAYSVMAAGPATRQQGRLSGQTRRRAADQRARQPRLRQHPRPFRQLQLRRWL